MNGGQESSFHHQWIQSFPPDTIKDYSTLLGTQTMIPVKKSNQYIENHFGQIYFEETFLLLIILSNNFTFVSRERSFSIRFPGVGSFTVLTSFLQRLKERVGGEEVIFCLKQCPSLKPSLAWKVVKNFCPLALLPLQKELFRQPCLKGVPSATSSAPCFFSHNNTASVSL